MFRRAAIFLICCLGCMTAQNGPFRVQTKVVQVPVRITDKNAQNIDGLTAHDFSVLDNGIRQEITVDGVPFADLARLRAWKQTMGRPKDLADILHIDRYLSDPSKGS